jgi:uncharacterized protein YdiU (UPF0061 family)
VETNISRGALPPHIATAVGLLNFLLYSRNAGFQFGYFSGQLGDGRAMYIGEVSAY